jgi:predicted small secreted protein
MTEHCGYTCTVREHANGTPRLAFEPLRGTEPKAPTFNVRFSVAHLALFAVCALTLAACQTDGAGPIAAGGPTTAIQQVPMTRSRASTECWMRTEKTAVRDNLDKRVDIVNKCIDEKMKAAGAS